MLFVFHDPQYVYYREAPLFCYWAYMEYTKHFALFLYHFEADGVSDEEEISPPQ
jgi:hypothetical protein